eukprot:m.136770 g.136770  ORF g.136770 m.136770 type:complete len:131 (+) comp38187_c0_seq10:303-695(+)
MESWQSLMAASKVTEYLKGTAADTEETCLNKQDTSLALLSDLAKLAYSDISDPIESVDISKGGELEAFNQVNINPLDSPIVTSVLNGRYLIPAHCSFLMSDVTHIAPLVAGKNLLAQWQIRNFKGGALCQ